MKEVKFKRFSAKVTAPKRVTLCSVGYYLFSVEKFTISSCCTVIASTDIDMKLDRKLVGKIFSWSSLSARLIEVVAGVVNSGCRGNVYVVLHNLSSEEVTFNVVDKIGQTISQKIFLAILSEIF